jgi:competence protein ComGC
VASAVLAGITSYTHAWQLPILAAFLLVWLVGGYYLQRWRLVKAALISRTKVGLLAAKMNFLGIFVGLAGFGVMFFLAYALNQREFIGRYLVGALSIALGIPTLVLLNWVVGMVLLKDVPAGGVLKLTAVNGLAVCVLMAACAAGAGIPANSMRQREKAQDDCRNQMAFVYDALQSYKRSHPDQTISVAELVSKQLIEAKKTLCPAGPVDGNEYVYAPSAGNDKDETRILLCDRQPFHGHGDVRMVLLDDATRGQPLPKPLSEQEFQNLLAKPVNAALAEQLKK